MKDTLKPGIEHVHRFVVPATKTVPSLYPESPDFQQMPEVLATGFMIGLLEWTCLLAIRDHLDWPREQTVGTRVDVSHIAATPPGMTVTARARLVEVDGRRLAFEVEAHDGVDLIGRGRHERHVIDRDRFSARVAAKAPALPPPVAVREIDHLVLRVADVARMLEFYRDLLGCPVERELEDLGLVQLRAGRSLIDLVRLDGPIGQRGGAGPGPEGRNLDHFCLRVHPFDPDALRARLAARGFAPSETGSRYGADGTGPSIYVEDPEGNTVELKGPPSSPPVAAGIAP